MMTKEYFLQSPTGYFVLEIIFLLHFYVYVHALKFYHIHGAQERRGH